MGCATSSSYIPVATISEPHEVAAQRKPLPSELANELYLRSLLLIKAEDLYDNLCGARTPADFPKCSKRMNRFWWLSGSLYDPKADEVFITGVARYCRQANPAAIDLLKKYIRFLKDRIELLELLVP